MIDVNLHNSAKSYEWTIVVLETGVERRADVVCLPEPPRGRGDIGISHSASSATTLVSVRNTRVFRTALTALTEPRTL